MRKVLVAIMCLGLVATVANANDILFYFSNQADNSGVPAEFTGAVNPVPAAPVMYLWAYVGTGDEWNGVALDITINNALPDSPMYNPSSVLGQRWNNNSDLDWVGDNHAFGVAVTEWGLGSLIEPIMNPEFSVDRHYRLGEITMPGASEEFLAVGVGGIARRGGNVLDDGIFFGFTDTGAWDGPLRGDDLGAVSAFSDIVPEPASLLLLGLAGLALRRR